MDEVARLQSAQERRQREQLVEDELRVHMLETKRLEQLAARAAAGIAPALRAHVAAEMGREAAIMKERRRATEAREAARKPPKGKGGERLGAMDTPFDLWRQVFNVNLFAPVALARGLVTLT